MGLTPWTLLIAPATYVSSASCVRHTCPLGEYARGVALEFALLFLTLTYVSSFGLHDCRRLLDRAPPNQRRTEPSDPAPTVRPLAIEDPEGPTRVLLGSQPPQQLPPGPLSP